MHERRCLLFAVLVFGLMACGGGADGAKSPGERACEAVADALAGSAQRCGFDYQINYDTFVETAAGGDCATIHVVRDEAALYDECVPFLQALTCAEVDDTSLRVPPSCAAQLKR